MRRSEAYVKERRKPLQCKFPFAAAASLLNLHPTSQLHSRKTVQSCRRTEINAARLLLLLLPYRKGVERNIIQHNTVIIQRMGQGMEGPIPIPPSPFVTDLLNFLSRVVDVVDAISSEWEKNQVRTHISGDQSDCCLLISLVDSALSPFRMPFYFLLSFFIMQHLKKKERYSSSAAWFITRV